VAAGIGRRLLDAGRAAEAVTVLEGATPKKRTGRSDLDDLMGFRWEGPDAYWESVYLDALDATGQAEHAERLRWSAFEERLSVDRLRAYPRRTLEVTVRMNRRPNDMEVRPRSIIRNVRHTREGRRSIELRWFSLSALLVDRIYAPRSLEIVVRVEPLGQ
jgi:hypothetical protein